MSMEGTKLCGPSGFRYHRIPPIVRALGSDSPDLSTPLGRRRLSGCESYQGYLPLPLCTLVTEKSKQYAVKQIRPMVWSRPLPFGAFEEVDEYLSVSSPLFTLLTLALFVDEIELTMAMYEMCGTFTTIKLLPEHERLVMDALRASRLPRDGWIPFVERGKGQDSSRLSSFWKRPALITVDELSAFGEQVKGLPGHKKFERCARDVLGIARSPFEVQTAMALSFPRRRGGEGFVPTGLNQRVRLTPEAKKLVSGDSCEIDLLFEQDDSHPALAIECQGRMVHGESGIRSEDSNKLNALDRMGFQTLILTYEQISDRGRYESIVRLIASKLGIEYRDKVKSLREAEANLRRKLFIDWTTLCQGAQKHVVPKRFRRKSR